MKKEKNLEIMRDVGLVWVTLSQHITAWRQEQTLIWFHYNISSPAMEVVFIEVLEERSNIHVFVWQDLQAAVRGSVAITTRPRSRSVFEIGDGVKQHAR